MSVNVTLKKPQILKYGNKQLDYIPRPSQAWSKNDEGVDNFYTYILKLENGDFYIGQTREIRERMVEHKTGRIISTAGKNRNCTILKYYLQENLQCCVKMN